MSDLTALIEAHLIKVEAALDAMRVDLPVQSRGWNVRDGQGHMVAHVQGSFATVIVLAVNGLRASIEATRDVLARHRKAFHGPDDLCSIRLVRNPPPYCCHGCGRHMTGTHARNLVDCPEIANEASRWGVS